MKKEIEHLKNTPKIILIAPQKNILKSGRDTNKERLNKAFDNGVKLAREYINSLSKLV